MAESEMIAYILQFLSGGLSETEEQEFQAWLETASVHRMYFNRISQIRESGFQKMVGSPVFDPGEAWQKMQAQIRASSNT